MELSVSRQLPYALLIYAELSTLPRIAIFLVSDTDMTTSELEPQAVTSPTPDSASKLTPRAPFKSVADTTLPTSTGLAVSSYEYTTSELLLYPVAKASSRDSSTAI